MKDLSLKQLSAIIILDMDGKRIAVKYYNENSQKMNEKVYTRTQGSNCFLDLSNSEPVNFKCEEAYNNLLTIESQKLFEADITEKVKRMGYTSNEVDIIVLETYTILFLSVNDINIYVVGDETNNELILNELLLTVHQSLLSVTNNKIDRKHLLNKLNSVYLLLDEIADSGIIMETNPNVIINRLYMQEGDFQEPTALNQAISSAKDNIIRSLLSGT
ncbi:coatomer subunit zeta, putative [Hepatocystis sp. ex Piliocolobus tephrosceles]|nr:coatomer subunit zeta, putative [Hepatocystis sp. ex Piliocolobus tephrosceles]